MMDRMIVDAPEGTVDHTMYERIRPYANNRLTQLSHYYTTRTLEQLVAEVQIPERFAHSWVKWYTQNILDLDSYNYFDNLIKQY
jgi:hypothetical protein